MALLAAADRLANSKNLQIATRMAALSADALSRSRFRHAPARIYRRAAGQREGQGRSGRSRAWSVSAKYRSRRRRPAAASSILAPIVSNGPALRESATRPNKYDFVFPDRERPMGRPKTGAARLLRRVHEEAGLSRSPRRTARPCTAEIRPYDLRHFYASMLIEQRVNLKRIQYLMGHEDISTTLNVYGHLIERVEAKTENPSGLLAAMAAE